MSSVQFYQHDWREAGGGCFIRPGVVDLAVADPPYNIGVKYSDDPTGDRLSDAEYFGDFVHSTLTALHEVLRPGGVLAWICPADHIVELGTRLFATGFALPYACPFIWHETFAQYQQKRPTKDYRCVFLAQKPGGALTFNGDAIRVESERQRLGDPRANPIGRVPGMVWKIRRLQGTSKDRISWHPAQLPPELLDRLILGWSNPEDLVLDAFAGSGSAALACRRHDRDFVGIDRSSTYIVKAAGLLGITEEVTP